MLNEWVYCPRLFHLMHVQGLFAASVDTVEGVGEHERMRARSRGRGLEPPPPPWRGEAPREITFEAGDRGVVGRFDVVAAGPGGLVPVEAKHGAAPSADRAQSVCDIDLQPGVWNNDQVQLGAQAMLLHAAGEACTEVRVWYRKTNTTVVLAVDAALLAATAAAIAGAKATAAGPMPPPLVDSPKCIGCSLAEICLPDETNWLLKRQPVLPRKVVAGRSDGGCLYVVSQGGRVGKTSEALTVATPCNPEDEVPLKDIEHVAVFGNVQVTTQAMQTLAWAGKGLHLHTMGGKLLATLVPAGRPNLALRRAQYRAADDAARCLTVARWLIAAKIRNHRVLVRRNGAGDLAAAAVDRLHGSARRAEEAADLASLLGIEGEAARQWFAVFATMLGDDGGAPWLTGRSRRPPADPGNALLSFGYTLLVGECSAALQRVGLDPDLGFLHQPVPGRPALALDLMEPYRPLIVDSLVLRMVNSGHMHAHDFAKVGDGYRMHDAARRRFVLAFEQRMDELVTHPAFDYRMSYRRVLEVEARLLGRLLTGELAEWRPMVTR